MSARSHRWNTGKYPHAPAWPQQSDNEQMLLEIMGSEAKWLWVISLPRGIVFCLAFCQAAYLSDRQNTQEGDKQHV